VPISVLFGLVAAAFWIAYRVYGKGLAKKFALDPDKRTPAHEHEDGEDYVPTKRGYLLAQHFSAISAAGPIVGPIAAALAFGWLPAILWIVFGCVFIGALHDFASLVASVRHGARSVPEIVREHMSRPAHLLFLGFVWLALVYVITAFTDVTARAFVEELPIGNGAVVLGAGVATASMFYLLLGFAMGVALKFSRMSLRTATLVFVPLVGVAIWFGQRAPAFAPSWFGDGKEAGVRFWDYALLLYCGVASIVPMWALLQPRGFLGGFFLYGVLLFACGGLILGGAEEATYPAFVAFESERIGGLFPFLFITIACGACSGFHGLVCSGTTSKQLDRETDAHAVGYGGMLLEGLVAFVSVACVMLVAQGSEASRRGPDALYALGIGSLAARFGIDPGFATAFAALAFATFVFDTLDVATRLGRYVLQELFGTRSRLSAVLATLATLALPAAFVGTTTTDAAGRVVPAWRVFWTIFGASNQLLAALTLLGLTVWLRRVGKPKLAAATLLPTVAMTGLTFWALASTLKKAFVAWRAGGSFGAANAVALILALLALALVFEAIRALRRPTSATASAGGPPTS
jgi:carbon starvation protein